MDVKEIKIKDIKLGENSRMHITDQEIEGLMQSIKEQGLLEPIGVIKEKNGYTVCYGNRRFLAVSQLGKRTIPAVVHTKNGDFDEDLANLTENVQRRNISVIECGRHINLLKNKPGGGMSLGAIAVRLGVTKNFVSACLEAYERMPKDLAKDIVAHKGNAPVRRGKIAFSAATAIINAGKSYNLSQEEIRKLILAAKNDDRFKKENIGEYSLALKRGHEDFIGAAPDAVAVTARLYMERNYYHSLKTKYVEDGPFRSMTELIVAILSGEKSIRINLIRTAKTKKGAKK